MKEYIEKRVYEICDHIIDKKATVRSAAKEFHISKSSVHKDVTERISELNPEIARYVKEVLDSNMAVRHLRGGEATRRKYHSAKQL